MATSRTIAEIMRIAVDVVRTHSFPVSVLGSMPADGGSSYIEILLRLEGYAEGGSRAQLGVFRDAESETLRRQIADQIRRWLANHR